MLEPCAVNKFAQHPRYPQTVFGRASGTLQANSDGPTRMDGTSDSRQAAHVALYRHVWLAVGEHSAQSGRPMQVGDCAANRPEGPLQGVHHVLWVVLGVRGVRLMVVKMKRWSIFARHKD